MKIKKGKGEEDHTDVFILVHPITWATSSPLQPLVRISTNSIKVYNQITQYPILNPTRLSSIPLCCSPPHKMHTHSANAVHHYIFECKHNNTTIKLQVSSNWSA